MISGAFFGLSFGLGGIGSANFGWLADLSSIQYVFQLTANEEILTCLALGYPAEGAGRLANHNSRKPIEETVTYL